MYSYTQLLKKLKDEIAASNPNGREEHTKIGVETKLKSVWKVLQLENFSKDIENMKEDTFDEKDVSFLKELLLKHVDNPFWHNCIENKRYNEEILIFNGKRYNAFDEITFIIDGMDNLYGKVANYENRKILFKETLYKVTDYRKIKLKHEINEKIENIPDLTESIINESPEQAYGMYENLFVKIKEDIDWNIKRDINGWSMERKISTDEIIKKLKNEKNIIPEPEIPIISNRQLADLNEQIFKNTFTPSKKKQDIFLKQIVFENEFSKEINSEGLTYEKIMSDPKYKNQCRQLNNIYANQLKVWNLIYCYCGMDKWLGKHGQNEAWTITNEAAPYASAIMRQCTSVEYKPVKKGIRYRKNLLELYWEFGVSIYEIAKEWMECFKVMLENQIDDAEDCADALMRMYQYTRYIDLCILHETVNAIGIIKKPQNLTIHNSDLGSEEAVKDFCECLKDKISELFKM